MRSIFLYLAGTLLVSLAWCPASSEAQPLPEGIDYSITPIFHADTDLDAGGEDGFNALLLTIGVTRTVNQRTSVGLRALVDYQDWDFDNPLSFGGQAPWSDFRRAGLTGTYARVSDGGWLWNFAPTIGYAGESGADFSNSIEYGAILAAIRRYSDTLTLGYGLGVFRQIEDTFVFPFLVVNWQINDRWRLTNPAPVGPAGPAGLALTYKINERWDTAFGATQRQERQRLSSDGPFPDGVGEHRYNVVFSRLGVSLSNTMDLNFYLGAELNSRLRVEDQNGNRLFSEDSDPGLILGISFVGRL